jgi:ankyrin repeat protein
MINTPQYCKIITEELSKRITQGVNDYEKKYLLTLVQDIIEYRILSNELNNTPLMIAVQYGRKENAKILLQFSRAIELTVNFEELLSLAGISGQNEMLNFLYSECSESQSYILQRSSEIHPFHRAASLGYINTVKWYIDKGYPVNSTDSLGCGAPIYAACNGNGKMLDFFMQEDCDPWLPREDAFIFIKQITPPTVRL